MESVNETVVPSGTTKGLKMKNMKIACLIVGVMALFSTCSSPLSSSKKTTVTLNLTIPNYAAIHAAAVSAKSVSSVAVKTATAKVIDPGSKYFNFYATPTGGSEITIASKLDIKTKLTASSTDGLSSSAAVSLSMSPGSYESARFEFLDTDSNLLTSGSSSSFTVSSGGTITLSLLGLPASPTTLAIGTAAAPASLASGKAVYYAYPVTSGTVYVVSVTDKLGTGGVPDLILFDTTGTRIAGGYATCATGGGASLTWIATATGTAYAAVYAYGGDSTYGISALLTADASAAINTVTPTQYLVTISGPAEVGKGGTAVPFTSTYAGTASSYQWYVDGTTVTGATSSSLSLNVSGLGLSFGQHTLGLNVTDSNGIVYSGTSTFTVKSKLMVAYVVNNTSNTVSAYTVDSGTGALTSVGSCSTGTNPQYVAIDPTGKFAYVANYSSSTVSAYTIDPGTGVLTAVSGSPFTTESFPVSVAVAPTGKFVYVANYGANTVSAYTINSETGALTAVSGSPFTTGTGPESVAVDPTGKFAYVANFVANTVSGYTIDSGTGVLSVMSETFGTGTNPQSVVVDPTGKFVYVANYSSSTVSAYTITSGTGALSIISEPFSAGTNPQSIAVDPTGRFAYVAGLGSNSVSAHIIDSGTGAFTSVVSYSTGTAPYSVAVDPTGRFAYVVNCGANTVSVYTIDSGTGALTPISGTFTTGAEPYSIAVAYIP
jgi:6-phosphogluconolactonase